jgi:hypothetical protein
VPDSSGQEIHTQLRDPMLMTSSCSSGMHGKANCMQRVSRMMLCMHAPTRRARDVLTALCCSRGPAEPLISPEVLQHIKVNVCYCPLVPLCIAAPMHAHICMQMCLVHLWVCYLLYSRLTDVLQGFAVAHFVRYKGLTGSAMVFSNLQVLALGLLLLAWSGVTHIAIDG